jgi:D-amino peptidase
VELRRRLEMRRAFAALLVTGVITAVASAQAGDGLKVFISVDMEGVTGVADWADVSRNGKDYDYFRKVMTREVNVAIEGAMAAGATDIVVRDAHGSARNILPELLDENARLIRAWSGGPKGMMEGVDESFDAVIFIGYHARAGTPDALLEHTSSGSVMDFSVNGISMPEGGYNSLIAGSYDVPVVFVAGEKALCEQMQELLGEVETVAVKEGIGAAAVNLHPEVARRQIRAGVEKALGELQRYRPYRLDPPFTLVLTLKDEEMVHQGSHYPGATRTGDWQLSFTSDDFIEVIKAFSYMRR